MPDRFRRLAARAGPFRRPAAAAGVVCGMLLPLLLVGLAGALAGGGLSDARPAPQPAAFIFTD